MKRGKISSLRTDCFTACIDTQLSWITLTYSRCHRTNFGGNNETNDEIGRYKVTLRYPHGKGSSPNVTSDIEQN